MSAEWLALATLIGGALVSLSTTYINSLIAQRSEGAKERLAAKRERSIRLRALYPEVIQAAKSAMVVCADNWGSISVLADETEEQRLARYGELYQVANTGIDKVGARLAVEDPAAQEVGQAFDAVTVRYRAFWKAYHAELGHRDARERLHALEISFSELMEKIRAHVATLD